MIPATLRSLSGTGWLLSGAMHRYMARWGAADVSVGADAGFFGTSSDIAGIGDDLTQRGLYLTPSVKPSAKAPSGVIWVRASASDAGCT